MMPDSARKVWREGFVPHLSTPALIALREALVSDDARLLQDATTTPPPLSCVQDWPVEGACLAGYCGWQGDGLMTVAEVEEYFARLCFDADQSIGEPAACRWLLNWWDNSPREEARGDMLTEVQMSLTQREDL